MTFDFTTRREPTGRPGSLSRREWALVAVGVLAWVLLAWGSLWLVRQLSRPPEGCVAAADAPTRQVKGAPTNPRNAVQLLAGTGRCP
jgi:hypothetical protein